MNNTALKLTVACLPLLVACAEGSGSARPLVETPEPRVAVEVRNQNFYSATIYAYRAGSRRRIGEVPAHETAEFTFEWTIGDLRFLIDFLATGCLLTESMAVDIDDSLLLILEPNDHRKAFQEVCRR